MTAHEALKRSLRKACKMRSQNDVLVQEDPLPESPDDIESRYELDEDLRTFEEKYQILDSTYLGDGCSAIVKMCVLREKVDIKVEINQENTESSPTSMW